VHNAVTFLKLATAMLIGVVGGGPREAIIGVVLVVLGIPACLGWRRGAGRAAG
jgi:hypothetical protein